METPVEVALITAVIALIASGIASFASWRASRVQLAAKLAELQVSNLLDKRNRLRDVIWQLEMKEYRKKDEISVQPSAPRFVKPGDPTAYQRALKDNLELMLSDFKFEARCLVRCLDLVPRQRYEKLNAEVGECMYMAGRAYETGTDPMPVERMLRIGVEVRALFRDELISVTGEIERLFHSSQKSTESEQ